MNTTRRRPSRYKQLAFDTAARNPERIKNILSTILKYEGKILDDDCLLNIMVDLYKSEFSSDNVEISDDSETDEIKSNIISANKKRNADGGYPKGYQSRFWTYMRTPSEFNLVYARYNKPLLISKIAKEMISNKIDVQTVFSIQAMKYNRKSPYRNVSNDFNYFRFILNVLLELKKQKRSLSLNQLILSMYSKEGNVSEFLDIISTKAFPNAETVYDFVKKEYEETNRFKTVTRDYPDVVLRVLRITGFITIYSEGILLIRINEDQESYINDLLEIDFSYTDEEKEDAYKYFEKANTEDDLYKISQRELLEEEQVNGLEYTNRLKSIVEKHNITDKTIAKLIKDDGKIHIEEFKYIPAPLRLEFYISLMLYIKFNDNFIIKPNYKADSIGMPISHAPGNTGDIIAFNEDIYWLIEVTLIRNKTQQMNSETTSVLRHFAEEVSQSAKYLSFVAPYIHNDTKEFYRFALFTSLKNKEDTFVKPYSIEDFVDNVCDSDVLEDMRGYSKKVIDELKSMISN